MNKYSISELIIHYFKDYFPELKDKNNLLYQSRLDEIKSTIDRWKKVLNLEVTQENIYELFDMIMNMKLCQLDLKLISKKENIDYYIDMFTKLQEYSYDRYYKKLVEYEAMRNNRRVQDADIDIQMQKRKYVVYRNHYIDIKEIISKIWETVNDLSYYIIMNHLLIDIDLKTILRIYDFKGNKIENFRMLYMPEEQSELLNSEKIDIDKFIDIEMIYLEKGADIIADDISRTTCYRNMYIYLIREYYRQIYTSEICCITELEENYKYNIHEKEKYNLGDISKIIFNSQQGDKKRGYEQINSSIKKSFKSYGLNKIFKDKSGKYCIERNEVELCLAYYEYILDRKLKKLIFLN